MKKESVSLRELAKVGILRKDFVTQFGVSKSAICQIINNQIRAI